MAGKFKLKRKTKLLDMTEHTELPESDFCCIEQGTLIQLEYIEESDKQEKYEVKPGIFTIVKDIEGLKLERTSFTQQEIYKDYVNTKQVENMIEKFFSKLSVYKKYKIEDVPRRGILLYGKPGLGKSSLITEVANKYVSQNNTTVILWQTDHFDPYEVKEFFKTFEYKNVDKMILVAEDIGGVEIDQVKIKSQPSLLALLANTEKTFTIPTLVLGTTNFPEVFLENLTNRRGRFDKSIEMPRPTGEQRVNLFKFFADTVMVENHPEFLEEFKSKKYNEFSINDIKEVIVRSELEDLTLLEASKSLLEDIKKFNNAFVNNKQKLGIVTPEYD